MNLVEILQNNTLLELKKIVGDEAVFEVPISGIATPEKLEFLTKIEVLPAGAVVAFIVENGKVVYVLTLKGRAKTRNIRIESPVEASKRDAKLKARLKGLEEIL